MAEAKHYVRVNFTCDGTRESAVVKEGEQDKYIREQQDKQRANNGGRTHGSYSHERVFYRWWN